LDKYVPRVTYRSVTK